MIPQTWIALHKSKRYFPKSKNKPAIFSDTTVSRNIWREKKPPHHTVLRSLDYYWKRHKLEVEKCLEQGCNVGRSKRRTKKTSTSQFIFPFILWQEVSMCILIQKGNAHTACFLSNYFVVTYLSSTYTQDKSPYLHRYTAHKGALYRAHDFPPHETCKRETRCFVKHQRNKHTTAPLRVWQ